MMFGSSEYINEKPQSKSARPGTYDSLSGDFTYIYIYIFGNLKCSRKADHILEMERLGLLCYYRFVNYICNM